MEQAPNEYIEILLGLEDVFKSSGELALQLRKKAVVNNKLQTGIRGIDIVTNADVAVQEAILSEMAKTKLIECELIAEEKTSTAGKFKSTNGLVLTLDPIDGTIFYATGKRFFSIIVCLHDKKDILYTFNYFPAVKWGYRIVGNNVQSIGSTAAVNTKNGINLNMAIVHTFGDPENTAPEIYFDLIKKGYSFYKLSEVTDESGSATLFFLDQTAGYFTNNPGAYDGLAMLHYGKVKKKYINYWKKRIYREKPYRES